MKNEKENKILVTFFLRQVAQGSRNKTSTKRKVDLRRKNKSNSIHRKTNLRAKKPFKREIDLRKNLNATHLVPKEK